MSQSTMSEDEKNKLISSLYYKIKSSKIDDELEKMWCSLARIDFEDETNPWVLFNEWLEEAKTIEPDMPIVMNLATAAKRGRVSSRTVFMRDVLQDGVVFTTNMKTRKIQDIKQNSQVAISFLWRYTKDGRKIQQEVRMEGYVVKLPDNYADKYFENEKVFRRHQSYICNPGEKINWSEHKDEHDKFLNERLYEDLSVPPNYAAFKMIPDMIEFYYSFNLAAGDRVIFSKEEESEKWSWERVTS